MMKLIKLIIEKVEKVDFFDKRVAPHTGCHSFSIDWKNTFHALSNSDKSKYAPVV